jgi:hypothetical protein
MTLKDDDAAAAAVAKAPRVALSDMEAAIIDKIEFTADHAISAINHPISITGDRALRRMSICILVLRNGFTVVGTSSPAADKNFNAKLGREYAYQHAVRQIWPLMGFSLCNALSDTWLGVPAVKITPDWQAQGEAVGDQQRIGAAAGNEVRELPQPNASVLGEEHDDDQRQPGL